MAVAGQSPFIIQEPVILVFRNLPHPGQLGFQHLPIEAGNRSAAPEEQELLLLRQPVQPGGVLGLQVGQGVPELPCRSL